MGYAHCEGQTANHKAALHAYAVAAVTNSKNPLPHLFSATSYLELSELDEARQSLDLAIEIAEGQQEYAYVKKEAEKQKSFILGR